MMKLKDAIEWAHRAEPAEVFIASHPRRTQNALWALVEEVERLTKENADLRAENVIIREHWTALEGERDAANALYDEYRGEVEELKRWDDVVCPDCHGVGERTVFSGQTPDSYQEDTVECGCITNIKDRARAEGMELAAMVADKHAAPMLRGTGCGPYAGRRIEEVAAAIRAKVKDAKEGSDDTATLAEKHRAMFGY